MELLIKDLECEREKLENKVKQLQKELVKTGSVEEQVITEIVTRENMKNEYDSLVKSMRQKQDILAREKEDNRLFYEKKIEGLNAAAAELQEQKARVEQEKRDWKGGLTSQGGAAGEAAGRQEPRAQGNRDQLRAANPGNPEKL